MNKEFNWLCPFIKTNYGFGERRISCKIEDNEYNKEPNCSQCNPKLKMEKHEKYMEEFLKSINATENNYEN